MGIESKSFQQNKLEELVQKRTAELMEINARLQQEIQERLRKEEALRKSESKFRLVTETIEDVFWMSTPGVDEMVYISPGYEKFWERTTKTLYESPRSFLESVHPKDRQGFENVIKDYHSQGKAYECEYRIIRSNGEIRYIHERGYPVKNPVGNQTLMAGICSDITKQKKIIENLHENQFRYAMAEKLAHIGHFIRDYETDTATWSLGAYRIFGIDSDTPAPNFNQFMNNIHPDDQERLKKKIQHVRSTKNSVETEYRFNHPDGEERTVRVILHPFTVDGGKTINLQGIIQDITVERLAEKRLKESETKYRKLFENELIALMVFDAETLKFEESNKAALNLYGYSKEEFLTLNVFDLYAEKDKTKASVQKIIRGDLMSLRIPLHYQMKKNGEVFPAEISAGMFHSYGKKKIICTVHDISERIQFEEELRFNENKLKQQAETLERTNTALRILLDHRADEKNRFEKNIINNLKHLITPYLNKIKTSRKIQDIYDYLNIVESNLNEITSVFSTELSSNQIYLTQTEIQIANLIKIGKTSKEIASTLSVTPKTVFFHRENIRKKLGLTHRKINLRSYLMTIL